MTSITDRRHEAKYVASRALLAAGFSHEQVGLAMLALDDDHDPDYAPEEPEYTEPELFAASPEDEAEYRAWCSEIDARDRDIEDAYREAQYQDMLEREACEREANAWTITPVR